MTFIEGRDWKRMEVLGKGRGSYGKCWSADVLEERVMVDIGCQRLCVKTVNETVCMWLKYLGGSPCMDSPLHLPLLLRKLGTEFERLEWKRRPAWNKANSLSLFSFFKR